MVLAQRKWKQVFSPFASNQKQTPLKYESLVTSGRPLKLSDPNDFGSMKEKFQQISEIAVDFILQALQADRGKV